MDNLFKNHRKDALIVFLLLAFVFVYFYQWPGWNENSRFSLIHAIVEDGSFKIDNFYAKPGTNTWDVATFDGHYYSDKAIGPAIIGSIFYYPLFWMKQVTGWPDQPAAHRMITFLVVGLTSAIAGSLMYLQCLHISGSRFKAYLATLAITLGTLYLPYSQTFFSHQFTASLLFIVFFLIFYLRQSDSAAQKKGLMFLVGFLSGWALISEYPSALIILALIIYYLSVIWNGHKHQRFISIVLPLLGGTIPVLIQMAYNKISFGSFFTIGYEKMALEVFSSGMSKGFMGIGWPSWKVMYYLTFHPGKGLFWESPFLLLLIPGAVQVFRSRRFRLEAGLALWIIFTYIILISGYYMWWGGRAYGPRHIIPILPFFSIFLASLPKRLNWLLVGLSLVSILQMFIVAASSIIVPEDWIKNIETAGFFDYTEIYHHSLVELLDGKFTFNLGAMYLHLPSWTSLVPVLLVITGLTTLFFCSARKPCTCDSCHPGIG
jgi:hypothetical protein